MAFSLLCKFCFSDRHFLPGNPCSSSESPLISIFTSENFSFPFLMSANIFSLLSSVLGSLIFIPFPLDFWRETLVLDFSSGDLQEGVLIVFFTFYKAEGGFALQTGCFTRVKHLPSKGFPSEIEFARFMRTFFSSFVFAAVTASFRGWMLINGSSFTFDEKIRKGKEFRRGKKMNKGRKKMERLKYIKWKGGHGEVNKTRQNTAYVKLQVLGRGSWLTHA